MEMSRNEKFKRAADIALDDIRTIQSTLESLDISNLEFQEHLKNHDSIGHNTNAASKDRFGVSFISNQNSFENFSSNINSKSGNMEMAEGPFGHKPDVAKKITAREWDYEYSNKVEHPKIHQNNSYQTGNNFEHSIGSDLSYLRKLETNQQPSTPQYSISPSEEVKSNTVFKSSDYDKFLLKNNFQLVHSNHTQIPRSVDNHTPEQYGDITGIDTLSFDRAQKEYEGLLSKQRELILRSAQEMLQLRSETTIKEQQEAINRNASRRPTNYLLTLITEEIVKTTSDLFSPSQNVSGSGEDKDKDNILQSRVQNQGSGSSIFIDRTTSSDALPGDIQQSIHTLLDNYKRTRLANLEQVLHQEASSRFKTAQSQVEERRRYWTELAASDAQAAHNLRMQEMQLQQSISGPNSSFFDVFSKQGDRYNGNGNGAGGMTCARGVENDSDANNANKLFPESYNHSNNNNKLGRVKTQPQTKTHPTLQSMSTGGGKGRGNGDGNGQVYLERARRGSERVLLSLNRMLGKLSALTEIEPIYIRESEEEGEDDSEENFMHLDTYEQGNVQQRHGQQRIASRIRPETLQALAPADVSGRVYEYVSALRHMALQLELCQKKHESLAHRLNVEFISLRDSIRTIKPVASNKRFGIT